MSKKLISVYGSLRKGFGNHQYLLSNAKYLGEFKTKPEFTLHSLGGFPGLKPNGKTSVVMEVYEVTPEEARSVDSLEGYTPGVKATFYDKIDLDTPFGMSSVYTYVRELSPESIVESGDWTEFKKTKAKEVNY